MKNSFRKLVNKVILPHSQLTYAQSGEDLILSNLFYKLSIDKPSYVDIGANHPSYISNTYYFYLRGSRGVCVEPNLFLFEKIKKLRKGDTVLNVGAGFDDQTEADFYLFPESAHGLSTFSKVEAEYWKTTGMKKVGKIAYEKVIKVQLLNINTILNEYCKKVPDFISIDVEGLDLAILQSLDFNLYEPKVFIVETLKYDGNQKEFKNQEIIDFMTAKGYDVYADTHVNTIFFKD
ncbi:MAG: FkbM family methyltransferase [Ginsengibacter sp.]